MSIAEFEEKEFEGPLNGQLGLGGPLWSPGQILEQLVGFDGAMLTVNSVFWAVHGIAAPPPRGRGDGRRPQDLLGKARRASQAAITVTHVLPAFVPSPIEAWRTPYEAMAREDQLTWATREDVTQAARGFLDPMLAGLADATWDPSHWAWSR